MERITTGRIAGMAVTLALFLGGCAGTQGQIATQWFQTSAERQVLSEQVYHQALQAVNHAMDDPQHTALPIQTAFPGRIRLPLAVILDVDETVLDNSAYQAMLIEKGKTFPYGWDDWIARAEAPAIPGVLHFMDALEQRHVTPIFITNRHCAKRPGKILPCPQERDTIRNLLKIGISSDIRAESVMLAGEEPGWNSEKEIRRITLLNQFRVAAIVGDDLGDFMPGVRNASPASRIKAAKDAGKNWGKLWFMLPNPMYGGWLQALKAGEPAPEKSEDY